MKTMKRALAMLMAAFIIAGIFAPVSPQAATKPTVSFYGWAKEDQSQYRLTIFICSKMSSCTKHISRMPQIILQLF